MLHYVRYLSLLEIERGVEAFLYDSSSAHKREIDSELATYC